MPNRSCSRWAAKGPHWATVLRFLFTPSGLALALLIPMPVAAFYVQGFYTGMNKVEVIAKAEKYATVQQIDKTTLVVNEPLSGYLSFNFCKDKLVSVQRGYPASLKQVTLLTNEFNTKYGQPFSINSGTRADPGGEIYELGLWWKAGGEFVSIYYMGAPAADSLSTSHQAKNSCFKVPR